MNLLFGRCFMLLYDITLCDLCWFTDVGCWFLGVVLLTIVA